MKITLIEPFFAGSHAIWAKEFARMSRHEVEILSLSGHHWKWRMHGGAVTLARRFLEAGERPDLVLTSDMLDLTTFLALTRERTAGVPTAVYFHENQLTYPWSPDDKDPQVKRDVHYGFINYTSALAADAVLFNSRYHQKSFLGALPEFLEAFPEPNESGSVDNIRRKCAVLPLGLDLKRFDEHRPQAGERNGRPPLILWNHRWEFDKNPQAFFQTLYRLKGEGLPFEVALLGESFEKTAPLFVEAKSLLGDRVIQFGYAESFADYARWLWQADIMPVTSIHDFFGASVVQALYCETVPLLPQRLAYPEHLPAAEHGRCFYNSDNDLLSQLRRLLQSGPGKERSYLRDSVSRYDWSEQISIYDDLLEDLTLSSPGG